MEDRRQSATRLTSGTRLTSSTHKINRGQPTCQNCGRMGECSCTQPIKSGSTGKIEAASVKSPLKNVPLNQNIKQVARRLSGKSQSLKPKAVAPEVNITVSVPKVELSQEDICLIHNKPLEVICRQDLTVICASCAIFCHKGHDFKSIKEFQSDKLRRCQDILELTDDRKVLEEKISGRAAKETMEQQFHRMKQNLVEEAKRHFKKIAALVEVAQQKCIERILVAVTLEYDRVKDQLSVPAQLLNRYRQWQVHAYEQIKAFENDQNLELQMKMLNYDRKLQEDIVTKGNGIITEFKHYQQKLRTKIAEGLGCLSMHFPLEVERKLERYSDFCVRRRVGGSGTLGESHLASTDDLLLNDSKEELEDQKEREVHPTIQALKMQQQTMKIEDSAKATPALSTPRAMVIPPVVGSLSPQNPVEELLIRKDDLSPLTTTDNNLELPYSSRIVDRKQERLSIAVPQNRSSILEGRKIESFCPEKATSSCISPLYRPRATTIESNKPLLDQNQHSTTLLPENSKSLLRIVTSPDNKLSSWPSVRSILSPTKYKELTNEQRIKRVLQKLKLPEKYQKVVTNLMLENLEVLDLSNCSVDETQIICIVELLKINRSVKVLKLIRNRLTDDFVERVLPFIGNIVTLNLSQNYLTERTLDYVMAVTNQLPTLRQVVLSQNRIREKTCKGKLDELKKMNISVLF